MTPVPSLVYFDTNVLIGMVEGAEDLLNAQLAFLAKLDSGEMVGIISELSLAEVMVVPLALNDAMRVSAYHGLMQQGGALDVVPISREILFEAARLRSFTRMKLPDAIHVATAVVTSCSAFVTADRGIRLPDGIRHIVWDAPE